MLLQVSVIRQEHGYHGDHSDHSTQYDKDMRVSELLVLKLVQFLSRVLGCMEKEASGLSVLQLHLRPVDSSRSLQKPAPSLAPRARCQG